MGNKFSIWLVRANLQENIDVVANNGYPTLHCAYIKAMSVSCTLCHSQGIVLLRLEEIYNIRVYMHVSTVEPV